MTQQLISPVRLTAVDAPNQPTPTPELNELYRGFEEELLVPLWTEIGDLMPLHPKSKAVPHVWRWQNLLRLADRAGHIVPVGRGGERRAIALANPALGGKPYATPTLWAAIQYLMPGEDAPEHRHTQNAFRFVVEGDGVWTVVERDPVPMTRGDFLPRPAGTGMHITTPPTVRWHGSMASTFPSNTSPRVSSSSLDAMKSLRRNTVRPSVPARSASGGIPVCGRYPCGCHSRHSVAGLPLG